MATEHMTLWLMTCLMLIGCSSSIAVRSFDSEIHREARPYDEPSSEEKARRASSPDVNSTSLTFHPPAPPAYFIPQCQELPCPPSIVKADKGSYRKVFFKEAMYAKIRVEGKTMMPSLFSGYNALRQYYMGNNSKKEKLTTTAPVIFRVDPGEPDGMFNPRNFTLFFYMDPKWTSPPTPADPDITVLQVNAYTLYIRTFSSYTVSYADWMRELLQLAADVEANGDTFRKDFYYFATYDSPFHFNRRINEVQLLAV